MHNATAITTGSANQRSNTPCIRLWIDVTFRGVENSFIFYHNYKTFSYCVNAGWCGIDFSQYLLVWTNTVNHCIAEFLTCPLNLKMFIFFRDNSSDIPDGHRTKARRKLSMTWMSLQSFSREDDYFTKFNVTSQNILPTKRAGFALCHFQCTFGQLL